MRNRIRETLFVEGSRISLIEPPLQRRPGISLQLDPFFASLTFAPKHVGARITMVALKSEHTHMRRLPGVVEHGHMPRTLPDVAHHNSAQEWRGEIHDFLRGLHRHVWPRRQRD